MANQTLDACLAEIKANVGKFYVYALRRPNLVPFYIGVGTAHGRRGYHRIQWHEMEARGEADTHKCRVIRCIWASGELVHHEIDSWHLTPENAFARESDLILSIGRIGLGTGPLVNHTSGGEGLIGADRAVRDRVRIGSMAYWADPASRLRHSVIKKSHGQRESLRKLLSESGKRRASVPGFRERQAEIASAAWKDPAHRLAHSIREKIKWADPERRRRHGELTKKQFSDPSAREAAREKTNQQFADPAARQRAAETTRRIARERRELADKVEARVAELGIKIKLPSRRGSPKDWRSIADAIGVI